MGTVRRAFFMATLDQYSQIVVSMVLIAVLSRLLDSTDIGVAAIGLSIGTIAFTVREFATSEFLIQREELHATDIRTGTTLVFGLSAIIAVGLVLLSPYIASFYNLASLQTFICLVAISGVIDGLVSPHTALLRREIEFGSLTRINVAGAVANAVTALVAAWQGYGFMSLAIAVIAAAAVRAVLTFQAKPEIWMFRPCLVGSRSIFSFGGYKGASSVLDRVYESLPQLVLGRIMPLSAVGIFNRANLVCGLPDKLMLSAAFSVAFPAFAAEVRAKRAIKESYLRMVSYISVLFWPSSLMLAILADPIVNIVLGNGWLPVVPILRILCCATIFSFANILTYPVLVAFGANRDAFTANFVGRGVSTVIICVASFQGLVALALSQFISLPFQMYVSFHYIRRRVHFEWKELLGVLAKSGVVTVMAIAGPLAIVALNGFHFDLSLGETAVCILLAAAGWMAGLIVFRHPLLDELPAILERLFGRWVRKSTAAAE
ncbi:sugar transporter [Neorhizobium sp. P12A]|uniref:oligosaccharide flippase family protein n=1 Tax=Neorhizobium sp. P12A TaxID=2268027 RepID=UPI0011F0974A|nr:oligosaccharide flippase family protein [Neorhizobium sp. P12A]KAA0700233.1 sugar transporter [Neorhizobium sp. P12A]